MTTPAVPPPPGWYASSPGVLRWWDGQKWTEHYQRQAPPPMPAHSLPPQMPMAMGPQRIVTSVPVETNHTFHLLMTIFTCGLWGFVWIFMIIVNSVSRKKHVTTIR